MLAHGRVPSLDPPRRVYSLTRIGGPLWGKAENICTLHDFPVMTGANITVIA
jgi:hypothetical protein